MGRQDDSGRNAQRAALWILVSTLLFVAAYPRVHAHSGFLQAHCRVYRDPLIGLFSARPEVEPELVAELPAVEASRDETAVPANVDKVAARPRTVASAPVLSQSQARDGLAAYLAALARADSTGGSVRIAYFGDSQIEGDLITEPLRRRLQARHGGEGVGFVPVCAVSARFRASIRHEFSGDWKRFSVDRKPHPPLEVGINGEYFGVHPAVTQLPDLWVTYRGSALRDEPLSTGSVRLFYGAPPAPESPFGGAVTATSRLTITVDDSIRTCALTGDAPLNVEPVWSGACETLSARWTESPAHPLYGFSFEGGPGVYVDNLSNRGSTGAVLGQIDPDVLAGFQREQHYDLIVLQFGLNLVRDEPGDFGWYQRAMEQTIRRFRAAMPDASILVVSIADKSNKNEYGELVTDPCVPLIREVQRRAAESCNAAYFDLFAAMGGPGSLARWVERDPPWAKLDYTHINWRGAERIADLLDAFLLEARPGSSSEAS